MSLLYGIFEKILVAISRNDWKFWIINHTFDDFNKNSFITVYFKTG